MLPPKLAQIMIHMALTPTLSQGERGQATIYDPFCGLGTVLIESILMQNTAVYGSDISPENIEKTKENLNYTRKNFPNKVKTTETLVLDAK
jgi:tRNA G10  N-methylase Trm11